MFTSVFTYLLTLLQCRVTNRCKRMTGKAALSNLIKCIRGGSGQLLLHSRQGKIECFLTASYRMAM